jgi:anti-sigma regulatory factor (Ser/Thr protein kinase)
VPTLICHVRRRLPVAVVDLSGTLDQTSAARAMVTLRDCLADAPTFLLVDCGHLTVTVPAALAPLLRLATDVATWPATRIGMCGAAPSVRVLVDAHEGATVSYASLDDGLAEALAAPVAPKESLALRADADSPAVARRFVDEICVSWGIRRASKLASLVASELVTNAVVHARTPSVMSLRLAGGVLAVTVRDGDPRPMYRPEPGATGAHDGDHGRGLLILDAMADDWGTLSTADGKVVWATVAVAAA